MSHITRTALISFGVTMSRGKPMPVKRSVCLVSLPLMDEFQVDYFDFLLAAFYPFSTKRSWRKLLYTLVSRIFSMSQGNYLSIKCVTRETKIIHIHIWNKCQGNRNFEVVLLWLLEKCENKARALSVAKGRAIRKWWMLHQWAFVSHCHRETRNE